MGSEISMVSGAINCGGAGININPFEYLPPNQSRPEWSEHDLSFIRSMSGISFADITSDAKLATDTTIAALCETRAFEISGGLQHKSVMDAIMEGKLNLKLDKSHSIRRINPFTRANNPADDGESIFTVVYDHQGDPGMLLQRLYAIAQSVYTDTWRTELSGDPRDTMTTDLVIFDLLCIRSACMNQEAYRQLSGWSPYCVGNMIATPNDIVEMGKKGLTHAWSHLNTLNNQASGTYEGVQSGMFVIAESPDRTVLDALFRRHSFIITNDTDGTCPISLVGVGNASFVSECTSEIQSAITPIATHPSHYQRVIGALSVVGGKTVASIGVHWHKTDATFSALLIEVVISTALSLPGVDYVTVGGDFNFQSIDEATRTVALVTPFHTHSAITNGGHQACITKVVTRSSRQAQYDKTHIQQCAPRIMIFSRAKPSLSGVQCLSSVVINGGTPETPNLEWPYDHGGVAATYVLSN